MKYLIITLVIVSTYSFPAITVTEDGKQVKKYLVYGGDGPTASGSQETLPHNTRTYIADKDETSLTSDMYYSPPLLGKSISYDIDLSQSGCSCNAAMYLVSMSGYDSS